MPEYKEPMPSLLLHRGLAYCISDLRLSAIKTWSSNLKISFLYITHLHFSICHKIN